MKLPNKSIYVVGFVNIVITFLLVLFVVNLLFSGVLGEDMARRLRNEYIEPILRKIDVSYLLFNQTVSKLPVYEITISAKKYRKLLAARDEKLKDRFYKFPYVKAKFAYEGKEYDVKVKLRGLFPNHWMEDKKSWRVKFPKENLFNGKRRINLIIPADRDYIKEYLAYYTARKFGIIAPESRFVILSINGRSQGVYFEVEQMGKEFLAHNFQSEDTDLYYGEDSSFETNIFQNLVSWEKIRSGKNSDFENYANIDKLLDIMSQSDEEFYRQIPQLVNVEKILKWNANSMLYFDYHQDNRHNVRLFFSAVTGLFEPLIWDCSHPLFDSKIDRLYNDLVTRILKDPAYLYRRNEILWNYVGDPDNLADDLKFFDRTYGDIKMAFLADSLKNISNTRFVYVMRRIREDVGKYYSEIKKQLNKSWAHAVIYYNTPDPAVFARLKISSGGFSASSLDRIEVDDTGEYELYYDADSDGVFDGTDTFLGKLELKDNSVVLDDIDFTLFSGKIVNEGFLLPKSEDYIFFLISREGISTGYRGIKLKASNAVTEEDIKPGIRAVDDSNFKYFDLISSSSGEFVKRYPFVKVDQGKGHFVVTQGEYFIDDIVIVPRGITLKIDPGVVLNFAPKVSFISYGKVLARGIKELPVVFKAKDQGENWGIFSVIGDGANGSVFSNVQVKGASEEFMNGVRFSGALAIHGAEALVADCVFEDNNGDDALNVKGSKAEIVSSVFRNNKADAIDLDFVPGGVVGECLFEENGNDYIDMGSSSVIIRNNTIIDSGDKGISCGEKSSSVIFNNRVSGCNIGVAAKDNSEVIVINCDIVNNKKGISSYMKKPLWQKAGTVQVYNSILDNYQELEILDSSGTITVENSFISDEKYQDKKKKVWFGKGRQTERMKDLPADTDIVMKYFPDVDKRKLRLGVF